jgi:hypothetical protein
MPIKNGLEIKVNFLEASLKRNLSWVSAADGKIPAIFAIDIAMIGLLCALIPEPNKWTICSASSSIIAISFLLGSIICLALTAFPRLEGPKGSKVYFGGIIQKSEDKFIKEIIVEPSEDILEDFARQIYRNAEIASKKFMFIKWAMICMFASVLFWLFANVSFYMESRY